MVHSWPPGGWGDAGKGGREAWHRQHLDRWLYQLFTACYIGCVISMMMESDNTLRQGFLWVCCISEFGLGRKRQADKRAQQLQIHGSVRAWSWESTCACFVCLFPADMPRSGTLCSIKAMFGLINHDIARPPPPAPLVWRPLSHMSRTAAVHFCSSVMASFSSPLLGRSFFLFFCFALGSKWLCCRCLHTQRERTHATCAIIHSWDFRLTFHQTTACIEYKGGREERGIPSAPTPIKVQSWEQSISDCMFWVGNLIFLKASTWL